LQRKEVSSVEPLKIEDFEIEPLDDTSSTVVNDGSGGIGITP